MRDQLCKVLSRCVVAVWILVASGGCKTSVEIEPDYEAELGVHMLFHPDQKQWEAEVYHTVPFNASEDETTPYVTDADVQVLRGEELVASLEHTEEGRYIGEGPAPEAGKTYTLKAQAPGFERVTATSSIPRAIPDVRAAFTDSVGTKRIEWEDREVIQSRMHLAFEDPAGRANYYQLVLERKHGPVSAERYEADHPALPSESFREIIRTDGVDDVSYGRGALFPDATFRGETFESDLLFTRKRAYAYQGVVRVLSEDLYRYEKTVGLREEEKDNPFREPAVIYSNVEDGAGIVAGYLRQAAAPAILDEITPEVVAGSYEVGERSFIFRENAKIYRVDERGRLEMTLRQNGDVTGYLFIPAEAHPQGKRVEQSFEGSYRIEEGVITFQLGKDTFISDVRWYFENGTLGTFLSNEDLFVSLSRKQNA